MMTIISYIVALFPILIFFPIIAFVIAILEIPYNSFVSNFLFFSVVFLYFFSFFLIFLFIILKLINIKYKSEKIKQINKKLFFGFYIYLFFFIGMFAIHYINKYFPFIEPWGI